LNPLRNLGRRRQSDGRALARRRRSTGLDGRGAGTNPAGPSQPVSSALTLDRDFNSRHTLVGGHVVQDDPSLYDPILRNHNLLDFVHQLLRLGERNGIVAVANPMPIQSWSLYVEAKMRYSLFKSSVYLALSFPV
jgi:hypothetical protein